MDKLLIIEDEPWWITHLKGDDKAKEELEKKDKKESLK